MACDGTWFENDTYLPFLLSVVGWTFVLTKSCILSTCKFIPVICSINCEIALRMGPDASAFGVGLACRLAVASPRRTTTVFDLRRIVDVVDDLCMVEDRFDHCSSYIMHGAKDCY